MMKCPVDGTELLMTERQGVEIDYCPKCRGVWLDRGELDKIIEKATLRSNWMIRIPTSPHRRLIQADLPRRTHPPAPA